MFPTQLQQLFHSRRGGRKQRVSRQETGQRGFSLVELLIVVAIIGIVSAIAIPNLLASRRAAHEASAVSALRTISSAEATYYHTTGTAVYATLSELQAVDTIDSTLAAATTPANAKNGYIFGVVLTDSGRGFVAGAAPVTASTGTRSFSSDEPGVIYQHSGGAGVVPVSTSGGTAIGN